MLRIVTVGCGAEKLDRAAPARDLYTGALFRGSLAYAERLAPDAIYILSALHGLLQLDTVIEPYNRALTDLRVKDRLAWGSRAGNCLRDRHPRPDVHLTILAGATYAEALEWGLRWRAGERCPWIVDMPLAGLTMGRRLQRLKTLNAGATP